MVKKNSTVIISRFPSNHKPVRHPQHGLDQAMLFFSVVTRT